MYFLFLSCNHVILWGAHIYWTAIVFAFNLFEKKYKQTL